jgi:hypothetical protein
MAKEKIVAGIVLKRELELDINLTENQVKSIIKQLDDKTKRELIKYLLLQQSIAYPDETKQMLTETLEMYNSKKK